MGRRFLTFPLFLLAALVLTVSASAATESGRVEIANRSDVDGAFSCDVKLSGGQMKGDVYAVLFAESGRMKRVSGYPAAETVKVALQDVAATDYVKILWTDENFMPLASPAVLRMSANHAAAYERFTKDLAALQSFNDAVGEAASGSENPYALKRLLVSCDALPDLSRYEGKVTTVSGPDNLYVLQFNNPTTAEECEQYLKSFPSVRYVEPDAVMTASADMETAYEAHSWGVPKTGIGEYAENLRQRGVRRSVIVAVVDSGVESGHPFLENRLIPGYDYVEYDDIPQDEHGHGTHVAGIVADCTPGMDVKIMPVRVLDACASGSYLSIAEGIRYAANHGANIINLSLGSTNCSQTIDNAVNDALSKNVTVVVAAGNKNGNVDRFCPAHMEDCVTVAAVDSDLKRYQLSNYGETVDVAAPGVDIESSMLNGTYGKMSGTSMATPHVSAAAALLMSERGTGQTPFQISSLIRNAATDLGEPGKDVYFGAGFLNLRPFVQRNLYALLYADGELVFQKDNAPDPDRELVKAYPVSASGDAGGQYAAWYERRADIKTVTFAEPVQPKSTALWFYDCENLTEVRGLENLNASEVTDMSQMFSLCASLTELDLSAFDTASVVNMRQMFFHCAALKTIWASKSFTTANVTDSLEMFYGCTSLVGGSGTRYDPAHTDKEYARIDNPTDTPGYFKDKNAAYTVTWSDVTGCTIRVYRESAESEPLSKGSTVYYGERLRVSYQAWEGYRITDKGRESIVVEGDVTESSIWTVASEIAYTCTIQHTSEDGAQLGSVSLTRPFGTRETYTPPDYAGYKTPDAKMIEWTKDQTVTFTYARNSYTYTVEYMSEHGLKLGSVSLTRPFGTKENHTPPGYAGYQTPSAREIAWNVPGDQTVTFTYSVSPVGYAYQSGRICDDPVITFGAEIQYQNRTADSVQIRVVWTDTIQAYGYDVYSQNLNVSVNGIGANPVTVAAFNLWGGYVGYERSSTGDTGWITIPVGGQTTSVSVSAYHYQANYYGTDMVAYGVTPYNGTWTVPIPAY